jgi:xanthine dehydrogenase YagT iron-sulfur-binding subunit
MSEAISPPGAHEASATPAPLEVALRVNGTEHRLRLDPRTTLLDTLREHLGLTGSKKGCGLGRCGAYDHIVAAIQDAADATGSVQGG